MMVPKMKYMITPKVKQNPCHFSRSVFRECES